MRKRAIKSTSQSLSEAASLKLRIGGYIVDYLLILIVHFLFAFIIHISRNNSIADFFAIPAIAIAPLYVYFIIMTYCNHGATFGKTLMGTKVIALRSNITISKILVRYGVLFILLDGAYTISNTFVLFSFDHLDILHFAIEIVFLLCIFLQKNHRGIHDLIAGTMVIKT